MSAILVDQKLGTVGEVKLSESAGNLDGSVLANITDWGVKGGITFEVNLATTIAKLASTMTNGTVKTILTGAVDLLKNLPA